MKTAKLSMNIPHQFLSVKRMGMFFSLLLAAVAFGVLLIFGRSWLRDRWYDIRDWQAGRDIPQAVSYGEGIPVASAVGYLAKPVSIGAPAVIPNKAVNPPKAEGSAVATVSTTRPAPKATSSVLSASVNLAIPFVSQAPHRVWDAIHEETCEEASLYMARLYYNKDKRASVLGAAGEKELLKINAWEKEHLGHFEDTTAAEMVRTLREMYNLKSRIVENPSIADIKAALAAGHPVIVPAYGKILPNPYFKNGGPNYHVFILKGYTKDKFISNDPGTNTRGADFTYSYNALINAIHDWNGGDVSHGAKRVIIVEGPTV